jgi:hypothetical protein
LVHAHTYLTCSAAGMVIAASAVTLLRPLRAEVGTTSRDEPAVTEG